MAHKRYFKATDGFITVFRASATKFYHSANFTSDQQVAGGPFVLTSDDIGFSKYDAPAGSKLVHPAEEIVESQYLTLVARKNERLRATGRPLTTCTPRDSWVSNKAVAP
jgi:hypothetical protein